VAAAKTRAALPAKIDQRAPQHLLDSNVCKLASNLSRETAGHPHRNHAMPYHSGTGVAPCVPKLSNFAGLWGRVRRYGETGLDEDTGS
jgi:hypothetical protein